MSQISIINTTKDYITLRIPRSLMRNFASEREILTESAALRILKAGMREYKTGKTRVLTSLRSMRSNGHRV